MASSPVIVAHLVVEDWRPTRRESFFWKILAPSNGRIRLVTVEPFPSTKSAGLLKIVHIATRTTIRDDDDRLF